MVVSTPLNNTILSTHSFIQYEPLQVATQPPQLLISPTKVVEWHTGDAFDMANVLCSCLIGNGYDAYVCYGTAPKVRFSWWLDEACVLDFNGS